MLRFRPSLIAQPLDHISAHACTNTMAAAAARRVTAALSTQRERTSGAADGGGNSTRMTPRVRQPLDYTLFLAAAARARSIAATATDCFTGRSIIKSHAASGRKQHTECAVAAAMAHRVTAALVPLPLVCTLIPAATAHASMRMRAMTTDCCMSAHAHQSRDAVGRAAQTSAALKGAETHGRPQRYY